VTRNQNTGVAQRPKPPTVGRSSLHDQQFEKRLRIAEHIVQALREAGHPCGLADKAYSLNGVDLPNALFGITLGLRLHLLRRCLAVATPATRRANAAYEKAHGRL